MVYVKFVPENINKKVEYKTFLSKNDALNHLQRHGYFCLPSVTDRFHNMKFYNMNGGSYAMIVYDDLLEA